MTNRAEKITFCAGFAALIAIGAFIKIDIPLPLYTMHFTMQWFFVLLSGLLLGARQGALCVLVYICIGLAGFPVFAAGGGPAYILRPGFGFLLGFIPAAFAAGALAERDRGASVRRMFAYSLPGMMIYYLCGAVYFYIIKNLYVGEAVPFSVIIVQYCLITVIPDIVLCWAAAVCEVRLRILLIKQCGFIIKDDPAGEKTQAVCGKQRKRETVYMRNTSDEIQNRNKRVCTGYGADRVGDSRTEDRISRRHL